MKKEEAEKLELEEKDYNPYCKNCDACGEEGCCSALMCAYTAMVEKQDSGCDYGESYYNDVAFYYNLGQDLYNLISEHGDGNLKQLMSDRYDKLWDEIYKE